MPVKVHHPANKIPAATTTTTANSNDQPRTANTNKRTGYNQANPNVSGSQRNSTSQTTLVVNRSKANLHKKRPTGLSRNNTSINLSKPTALSQQKKPTTHNHKPSRKGAFKGALDADPDDDDEIHDDHQQALDQHSSLTENQTQAQNQNEEEVWVSEPSTRCTTPTHHQPVLVNTSDHHQPITDLQLELQLPNPLSPTKFLPLVPSSIPLSPPQQHPHHPIPSTSQPQPSSPPGPSTPQQEDPKPAPHPPSSPKPDQETRGRSKSRHRSHNPIERSTRSELSPPNLQLTIPTIHNSPEPLHQHPTPSPNRPESPQRHSHKGKAKASPGSSHKPTSGKRSSINSVRSLSSLVIFHNDALLKSQTSRLALKRVDSTASVVLPPKVDTTEAIIALNGKASFNPTLMSISDFPSELTSGRSESTPNTAVCSPVATSSKSTFPSRRALPDSPHHYSSQPDQRSKPGQPCSPSLNPSGARLEQSECARRLKKYSHLGRPSQLINMQAANECSSGLMSSLLSPGLTFKSRRSEPNTHGNGYFDSFKSLVGISSLADQVAEDAEASKAASPELARRSSSTAEAELTPAGQPPVGTSSSSLAKRDPKTGISLNGVRYPFAQSQKLLGHPRPTQPTPAVPGFITTCGSQPVVSKFLGPLPSTTTTTTTVSQPVASTSAQPAPPPSTQWSMTDSPPDYVRYPTDSPSHSSSSRKTGTENTGSLTRIQKKLLMERDRPISPTLFDTPSPPTPAGPTSHPPLPPPSYLIRSLGGQTGPLPFIPFNLLPSDPAHFPASVLHDHSHPPPFPPPPHPSAIPAASPPPPPPVASSSLPSHNPNHHLHPSLDPLHHHHHHQQQHEVEQPYHPQQHQEQQLNQPALKAKQALSIKLWRNSLIDEVEQVLTDHESNTRFRNPLFMSLARVSHFNSSL